MTTGGAIKLLLSDVDGTLVTHDKLLTPAVLAAAASLGDAGIGLALTSARPPIGMRMLIEPLHLRLPLAGFNGGLIVDPQMREIEAHPIPQALVHAAIDTLKSSGLDIWVYTDKAWSVPVADGPHVAREAWILKTDPVVGAPEQAAASGRVFKIVGVSDDHPKVEAAEAAAQKALGAGVSATRSEPHFLDITAAEATKGKVVHALAKQLGIATDVIATIGDMPNDVLMFRESGLSIAMGNASDAVQASANVVTDTNEQDGFAKAVQRFLLASHAA